MNHLVVFLVILFVLPHLSAQDADFAIELGKDVATKLPHDTQVSLWHPRNRIGWQKFNLNEFPIKVARSQLAEHGWNLTFVSNKETLFGMHLDSSFIRENNAFTIAFKEPVVKIQYLPLGKEIRCIYEIGSGIEYTDLPRLDPESRILKVSLPPAIEVTAKDGGEMLYHGDLVDGCMGIKWCCPIKDVDQWLVKDSRLKIMFDSGGLFTISVVRHDLRNHAK